MLLALVISLSILLVLSLFIICVLVLGIGAWGEYLRENHLRQPSGDELRRLMKQWAERRLKSDK